MRKKTIRVISGVLILVVLVIGIVNVFVIKNAGFWNASISQILTLLVAIVIAFWAAQKKTDERKVKEQIEKITSKIQLIVSSTDFFTFNTNDNSEEVQKRITMSTRKLKNGVDVLQEYCKEMDIATEVKYIEDQIRGYSDFVSVKVGDLDYLSKSESHLKMYAENINSKCDYIIMKLYTKL